MPLQIKSYEDLFRSKKIGDSTWLGCWESPEASLMIVLSHPSFEDIRNDEFLKEGDYSYTDEFDSALASAGLKRKNIVVTSMVKRGLGKLSKPSRELIEEGAELLDFEITAFKPKLIMPLGAEAFKRLMKKNIKIGDYMGEIIDSPYGKILPNYSLGMIVSMDPSVRPLFRKIFEVAKRYIENDLKYTDFTWEVVTSPERNKKLIADYINKGQLTVGYDGEWLTDGKLYDDTEIMCTLQYCCEDNHAIVLDLVGNGKVENRELLDTMKPLLEHPQAKRLGWNVRADDKRLVRRGFQLPEHTLEFDGMKAIGFIDSRWGKGLETGIRLFTDFKPYYVPFYVKLAEHKLAKSDLCNLKYIEPDVFFEYCAGDAVSHYTACLRMQKSMRLLPPKVQSFYTDTFLPLSNYFIDLENCGIPVNLTLLTDLTQKYHGKYMELKMALNAVVIPKYMAEFNANSALDKRALLYDKMKLTPPYYTKGGKIKPAAYFTNMSKPKKPSAMNYAPSSNNKSLSTLKYQLQAIETRTAEQEEQLHIVSLLLDMNRVGVFANKFLSQRGVVRDEIIDYDDVESDDEDEPIKQSYWAALTKDNRVHADFYECLDNFRSSSRPNVQNPASKVLAHIPHIFIPEYHELSKEQLKERAAEIPANIRNIFYAPNPNYLYTSVDLAGSDLMIAAYVSRDQDYITDMLLGDFHLKKMRDYYRDQTLTKDHTSKYVSGKAITFRVAYTSELQSAAIPIQAEVFSESGILVPLEDISYALNTWTEYKQYMKFREGIKADVENQGYVCNTYGSKFYFESSTSPAVKAGQYNTALAWCIASVLAQLFWDICIRIKRWAKKSGHWMTNILPINVVHDDIQWLISKDLFKDNTFPEAVKYYITECCKLPTGDTLGMELIASDCWKGKEKFFSKETKWNFETKRWDWK